jgi:endonuclease/exonuclease/phosphatase (EEP) superfamily protein YafD
VIGGLLGLAGLAVIAATAVSYLRRWQLELCAHFRPHLAAAAIVLAILILVVGAPYGHVLALVLMAAAALNTYEVWQALLRAQAPLAGEGPAIRIAFANLFINNRQHQRAIDWVRAEKPDLFIACEAYHAWPSELAVLAEIYPFATRAPLGDILVFSRWPSVRARHAVKGWNGHAVVLDIESEQGPLTVVGLHTMVPWREEPGLGGYNLINDLGDLLAGCPEDVIVLGDFNATPWSRPMRRLVERTGLSLAAGSAQGSFPTGLPSWLGLPIDLALARGRWHVRRHMSRRIGSDHWPVVFEVVSAAQAAGTMRPYSSSAPVSPNSRRYSGDDGPPSSSSA